MKNDKWAIKEIIAMYSLTLIFIILKITGNINWSWVWVLSPIWIRLIILLTLYLILKLLEIKEEREIESLRSKK